MLIGDAGVGKTCAVQRFKHGIYVERHGNTIGVDFMLRNIEVDGKQLKVHVHRIVDSFLYNYRQYYCILIIILAVAWRTRPYECKMY